MDPTDHWHLHLRGLRRIKSFPAGSGAKRWDLKVAERYRNHLIRLIHDHDTDLDHKVIRHGSPFVLQTTKNCKSWQEKKKRQVRLKKWRAELMP